MTPCILWYKGVCTSGDHESLDQSSIRDLSGNCRGTLGGSKVARPRCADDRHCGCLRCRILHHEPGAQRRGIGTKLLDYALRLIGPEAWTNMLAGNEPAQKLYQAAGMEIVWTRDDTCEGYPCRGVRLALPTSRMRDPHARRPATDVT